MYVTIPVDILILHSDPAAIVEVEAEGMLTIYICTCVGIIILVAVVLLACCNPSSRKPSTPLHQIDCGHSVIY